MSCSFVEIMHLFVVSVCNIICYYLRLLSRVWELYDLLVIVVVLMVIATVTITCFILSLFHFM